MWASVKGRRILLGAAAVIVAIVAAAFALGGGTSSDKGTASSSMAGFGGGGERAGGAGDNAPTPVPSAAGFSAAGGSGAASAAVAHGAVARSMAGPANSGGGAVAQDIADGTTATRIVKTGDVDLRVAKNQVDATVATLVKDTTDLGGYVARSETNTVGGLPSGQVTLRIPVSRFEEVVADARALGHVTSLTTSAHDVTGKYVDLTARLSALERTRSTYLTILSHARTIGATLEVQQRVDDVQQQIEELQGELKVLGNQTSFSTLSVSITPTGTPLAVTTHHTQAGLGQAWHRSVHRFNRGIDALVAGLGPLLFVLLLLGALALIGRLAWIGGPPVQLLTDQPLTVPRGVSAHNSRTRPRLLRSGSGDLGSSSASCVLKRRIDREKLRPGVAQLALPKRY